PTGALDQHTGYEVLQVLTEATRATGAALVVVTHDPQVAAWCSRTVQMRDGRVVADTADGAAPAGQAPPPGATHPGAGALATQGAPSNAPAGAPPAGEGGYPAQAAPSWNSPVAPR